MANINDYPNAKLLKAYPGYAVTSCGKVLSLPRKYTTKHPKTKQPLVCQLKEVKELKPTLSTHGHLKVDLRFNGKRKTAYVKNLVAEAFCKKITTIKSTVVVHLDENKANCAASNLSWLTLSQFCKFTNNHEYRLTLNK